LKPDTVYTDLPTAPRVLPADDGLRHVLHNEVHARPSAAIQMPALVVFMAVYNDGVDRAAELAHLRRLPGQEGLAPEALASQFLRVNLNGGSITWERHTEFTRYSVVQDLPSGVGPGRTDAEWLASLALPPDWLAQVPGRTFSAILLAMLHGEIEQPHDAVQQVRDWFGDQPLVASRMGNNGHSVAVTDFVLRDSGFERMVVVAPPSTSRNRAGRISQRLLELETYRLMALRGLPVAKVLSPELSQAEQLLSTITADLERKSSSDEVMLDTLVGLAAGVEKAMAQHVYRFSATRAYHTLVTQRIAELREKPITGIQTIGEFMQRRLSPAMATVASTERRLSSLSERVARTSDLLRTRVDIATEEQNRQLLEKLTKGQELQLRLQSTVEGLSIAAISYYVISLLLYGAKALKSAGVPVHPEMAAGAMVPVVLWAVWRTTKRIHEKLHADG
jgi:uncharacterized membrane-anchored protein